MAALSADTQRKYEYGEFSDLPVKASSTIYRGDTVGMTSGYARQLVAGDLFAGFASAKAVGTGSDGGAKVNVIRDGLIELAVTSLAVTDIGKAVWASDSNTFSLTPSTGTRIGVVARFVSTGIGLVKFSASRVSGAGGIVPLTDSSGGAAANDTIGAVTAPTAITNSSGSAASDGTIGVVTLPTAVTVGTLTGSANGALELIGATNSGDVSGAISNNFQELYTAQAANLVAITALRDAIGEFATAQTANRTAIIALTDAITEVATKVNEILNNLE